jgi:hypothetical protein
MNRRGFAAAALCTAAILLFTGHGFAMSKSERQGLGRLLDTFVSYYQAGSSSQLPDLHAAACVVKRKARKPADEGALQARDIRQQYAEIFGKQKDVAIRGIIIIGGVDGFSDLSPGKARGTFVLRFTLEKGGRTFTLDRELTWTVIRPSGGSDWLIAETSDLVALQE